MNANIKYYLAGLGCFILAVYLFFTGNEINALIMCIPVSLIVTLLKKAKK
jgi:hypothetical protein